MRIGQAIKIHDSSAVARGAAGPRFGRALDALHDGNTVAMVRIHGAPS